MESKSTASVEQFISLLLKCRKAKDIALSKQIHVQIALIGYEAHVVLGNFLVQVYADCGRIHDARFLFNTLVHADEYSWTSLIQGHVECREYDHALALFHTMQETTVRPSNYTFVAVVKACGHLKALNIGLPVHMEVVKMGLDGDSYIGNTLLSMYTTNGSLVEAQKLFDLLPIRIVVSWNILITGYLDFGLVENALECLDHMESHNVLPNEITFIGSLKACSSLRAVLKGRELHSEAAKLGAEGDLTLGTTLVNMYSKCGLPLEAQAVVHQLHSSSVVPWNALITGYVDNTFGEKALQCMNTMRLHCIPPNAVTFVCGLKACTLTQDLNRGQEMHSEIVKAGFDCVPSVGNTLLDLYGKCGAIMETCELFDKLPNRSIVSWTSLITGYVEYGANEKALSCLEEMCLEGFPPDAAAYVCGLKACGSLEMASMGRELHAMILKVGHERNLFLGNTLLDTYVKGGSLTDGQGVFNALPFQNLVSWNTLIAGYTERGFSTESLALYSQMKLEGLFPDVTTFICTLKACACTKDVFKGQLIHADIISTGLESAGFVGNTIVDMYIKCGSCEEAYYVFNLLPAKSTISWNAIITGFSELGLGEDVFRLLDRMHGECISSDTTTYVHSFKACSSLKLIVHGQEQHKEMVVKGLEAHSFIGSVLVDMYASCGLLMEALKLLDGLPTRNVVVWTALIAGYAEHGLGLEALECFERMLLEEVLPNNITYACILKVCGNLSALIKGEEVHCRVTKEGLLGFHAKVDGKREALELEGMELLLFSSLVDMYCKCGNMIDAQGLFDRMPLAETSTWNALLTGYARRGDTELVFRLFDKGRKLGIEPNEVMFLTVLSVCSHGGLVRVGQHCFEAMKEDYCMHPTLELHNCLTDLLSRAGQLEEAIAVLENMPFEPDLVTWSTLLGASRNWGDVDLGRQSFEWVARLDKGNAAAFIVMSNIFAKADMWEDDKIVKLFKQIV